MTQMLFEPSHPRGGLHRPCDKCGKLFKKTGRYCKLCFDCAGGNRLAGTIKGHAENKAFIHCSKCNCVVDPKIGYIVVTRKTQNNIKFRTSPERKQSMLQRFCDVCWDKIISKETLQFDNDNKINKIRDWMHG